MKITCNLSLGAASWRWMQMNVMGLPSRLREGWSNRKKIRKFSQLSRDFSKKALENPFFEIFFQAYQSEEGQSHRTLMEMLGPPTWSVAEVWSFLFPWIFLGFEEDWGEAKFEAIAAASVWIWPGWKTFPSVTRLRVAFQESQAQETIEENRPQRQDQETQDWWNVVFANCWFISRGHESVGTLLLSKQPYSRRNKLAGSKWFENCEKLRKLAGWMFSSSGFLVGWHLWLEQPHGRATRMFKKIGDLWVQLQDATSSFATFAVGKHDFCLLNCAFLTWIKSSLISLTQFHQVSLYGVWSFCFINFKFQQPFLQTCNLPACRTCISMTWRSDWVNNTGDGRCEVEVLQVFQLGKKMTTTHFRAWSQDFCQE